MRSIVSLAPVGASSLPAAAWAQGPGPWPMHDWTGWGWGGGMWLGPLFMIALLVLLIAAIVALVRWMGGGSGDGGGRVRTARDILDERYARGEIDREEYQRRRDLVYAALAGTRGVTVRKPEGAFYLCPRIPVDDAEDFAVWLLRDFDVGGETVMVAPADGFYATPGLGKDEIRIAYVLEERKLARAMDILTAAFAAYPGRKVEVGRA